MAQRPDPKQPNGRDRIPAAGGEIIGSGAVAALGGRRAGPGEREPACRVAKPDPGAGRGRAAKGQPAVTTALIYIRQSRHREQDRTVSPETQEVECRALAPVRACDRVEVFTDLDKSAKSVSGRKEFQAFLQRIREEPPAVIAVYDQSRTFRNTAEALDFFALMERLTQIQVVFHIGHFDRSPVGEFSYTTLAAAHTMERKMTGQKTREAMRYSASQGRMVGPAPAGYRWQGKGRDRDLVVDEDAAAVVRRLFDEYATGRFSTRDIARRLNAEGIKHPKGKVGGWRQDTVAQMLGSVVYIGKTYVSRLKREGPLIDAQWPALVEEDTWNRVQELLVKRRWRSGGGKSIAEQRPYVFQRLLRCVRCGKRLNGHTTRFGTYYNCRNSDAAFPCRGLVREDHLLPWAEQLFEMLDAYRPPHLRDAVAERIGEDQIPRSSEGLHQIEMRLERITEAWINGWWTEERFRTERTRLEALRDELRLEQQAPSTPSLPLGGLIEGWRTGDARTRRELLATFFDELDVLDREIVAVVPRADRAAEVMTLLEEAYAEVCRSGPCGLRTRDFRLERPAS